VNCQDKIVQFKTNQYKTIGTKNLSLIKHSTNILFDVTYRCNDTCDFCCVKHMLDKGKKSKNLGEMSFNEIKENAFYLSCFYNPSAIIISGGEPTMHPDFWSILDFFHNQIFRNKYISLNTNCIFFSKLSEAKRLYEFLLKSECKKKIVEISLSSINKIDNFSKFEEQKMKGVTNTIHAVLKSNTKLKIFLFFTQNNYKIVPKLINHLFHIIDKYPNPSVTIETGLLSLDISKEQYDMSIPRNYDKLHKYMVTSIKKILQRPYVDIHLTLPLCLIKNDVPIDKLMKKADVLSDKSGLLWINVWQQKTKMQVMKGWSRKSYWRDSDILTKYCSRCSIESRCNKIKEGYLKDGIIKELYPFK